MSFLSSSSNFNLEQVLQLQNLAKNFIEGIATDKINHSDMITKITSIILAQPVDATVVTRLSTALETIQKISTISATVWESDGKVQRSVKSRLVDLLIKTLADNYHTVVDDCKSFDKKTGTCKFNNPLIPGTSQHRFVCDFHLHDSVSVHLVLACIYNGLWAVNSGYDDRVVMLACLFGLYHDVAKPLSVETYEFKNTAITGFPGHAEVGAMLFNAHYSPEMNNYISYTDYFTVSQAILRHMCGYHGDEDASNAYKRDLLMLESDDVRQLLTINRVGDHFGKLVDGKEESEPIPHFLTEQKLFETRMSQNNKFDLAQILKTHANKHGAINPDKIVVYLIGTSGAGKSYLLTQICNTFPNAVTYISRDECIADVCVNVNARLEGEDYTKMYKIYESGKSVASYGRKIASKKKLDKRELTEFANAKTMLIQAQTEWNNYIESAPKSYPKIKVYDENVDEIPNISGDVQALYDRRITQSLSDENLFLVMDTFMNCFPMAIEANVPNVLKNYFRVHIHVQSYLERTSTSIAESIADQLRVSGPYGLDNPLHPDGFKNGQNKKAFASLSSEIGTEGPLPRSTFTTKFRPHLVYLCTRTETGDHGYAELFSSLKRLTSCYMQEKSVPTTAKVADEKNENETEDQNDTFGVDPETKDKNIVQFYRHLMEKYAGDRNRIREFMQNLAEIDTGRRGFMHNLTLEKSFGSMDENEQIAFCTSLSNLSREWCDVGVVSTPFSVEQLMTSAKDRELLTQSIVQLKYFEQGGARFWHNVWAKETRGTSLFVSPKDGDVKILSFKLPRGAEAVTGMVTKNNLETQDVKPGTINLLDDEQRDTCARLCTYQPIRMHLTSKGDGSLMIVNAYTGSALKIVLPLVMNFGSDYTRLWATQSMALTNGTRLLVPATQGTLMERGFTAPYMVTSLLAGSGICSREDLVSLQKTDKTYVDAWKIYGESWMKKFLQFSFFDDLTETHTFSFEAMCKDRCGLFGDTPHIELACSYDRDRLIFLGVALTDRRFYIPHSLYGTLSRVPFEEPLWWDISHASQVDSMIDAIGKMILGEMKKEDFIRTFTPSNKGFDVSNGDSVANAIIDYEGWVAMKFASFDVVDPDYITVIKALNVPVTIYSKIKTEPYYRAHKFHVRNIPYLAELAKTAGHIFPLARKVTGVCRSGAIAERFAVIGEKTTELLDFKSPHNTIVPALHTAFEKTLADAQEQISRGENVKLPKNPLIGFEKRPFNVQCRIALNFRNFDFGELLLPIYLEAFPEMDPNTPDLKFTLVSLTMELEPWKAGYSDRIKDLNPSSSAVQGLIVACIGASVN